MPSPSTKFSLSWVDIDHWFTMLGALLAAVIVSFLITAVLPSLSGNWAVISLGLTPLLHLGLMWLKNNDNGSAVKPLIDALPGKDQV